MSSHKDWSVYWSQGHKTSFGNAFSHCYEGKLKEAWQEVFTAIESNNKVLDLCTGNASLLRLAEKDMVNFSEVIFTGVDYASISVNDSFTELSNIELLFNVNVENLPLKDNSVDVVISNFGIEYSDLSKSLGEVSRVLSPKGSAIFICHFYDSVFIKSNSQELTMMSTMLESGGVLEILRGLTVALKHKTKYSKETESDSYLKTVKDAEHCRHLLNQKLEIVANNFPQALHQSDFLIFLKYLLSAKIIDKESELTKFKEEMISHQARLSEMVNAALTKDEIENLPSLFEDKGLLITKKEAIKSQDGAVGYQIFTSLCG
jgi:ubiquinone/menaquinone biosynthesis C-methylase UbiE